MKLTIFCYNSLSKYKLVVDITDLSYAIILSVRSIPIHANVYKDDALNFWKRRTGNPTPASLSVFPHQRLSTIFSEKNYAGYQSLVVSTKVIKSKVNGQFPIHVGFFYEENASNFWQRRKKNSTPVL